MLQGDFHLPKRNKKTVLAFGILGVVGLIGLAVIVAVVAFVVSAWLGLPLNAFGLNDGPDQPIASPTRYTSRTWGWTAPSATAT